MNTIIKVTQISILIRINLIKYYRIYFINEFYNGLNMIYSIDCFYVQYLHYMK
jgi:hypothetical protein